MVKEGRMDGGRFDLYFGPLKVGVVIQTDSDFPNLWGALAVDPSLSEQASAEAARLLEFIALDRESSRLRDLEDEGDTSPERERQCEALEAKLSDRFGDFIETDRWHLVDENGRVLKILCPVLRCDGEIVWRWNPDDP
jgi:hypothetical protein